jgi:crotonobetainyl-CoA:carnitine CoA-transferase CaiB-like acyl-CoA transferase
MATRTGALAGLQVVDLSRVLGGPYCTQILGDHGADVLKIEPPGGDETRGWGPPFVEDTAAYFRGVNRNKRSLVLDLAGAQGRDVLLGFLEGADVLVENYKPSALSGSSTAACRATGATARWAACPATTRRSRPWRG